MTKARRQQLIAVAATLAILGPLAYLWQASRMPGSYSIMDIGYVDTGGGPNTMAHHGADTGSALPTWSRTRTVPPTSRSS